MKPSHASFAPFKALAACATLLGLALFSCQSGPTAEEQAQMNAAKSEIDSLRARADQKWADLTSAEADKYAAIEQALMALETKGEAATKLEALLPELKSNALAPEKIVADGFMESYNARLDSMAAHLAAIPAETEGFDGSPAKTPYEEAMRLDQMETKLRGSYKLAAETYNEALKNKKAALDQVGGEYAALEPMPVFTYQDEIETEGEQPM